MRRFTKMYCKKTGQDEWQLVVKESEDGIYLKCEGCGVEHGHEIGEFADKYQLYKCREVLEQSVRR